MQVTKVKVLDSGVTVEWGTVNAGTPETHALANCEDPPHEKLKKAMSGIKRDVAQLLGLETKQIKLTGLSVSKDGKGHRGFVFTAKLITPAGDVALNTVRMRERVDAEEGVTILADTTLKKAQKVLAEGAAYVKLGTKRQTELDLTGTE